MKLHILSDLHNEFELYKPHDVDADVVILAGDIDIHGRAINWAKQTFPDTPVIYVLGNHEYYSDTYPDLLERISADAKDSNVHVLENDHIKIGGIHFLGCTLWTDFMLFGNEATAMITAQRCMNDFKVIHLGTQNKRLSPHDTLLMHSDALDWLRSTITEYKNEPIVIVTHHAPSAGSIAERYSRDQLSAAFASGLDYFVKDSKAILWVHGHTHNAADYRIGDTRIVCNPRGYPGENTGFNPALIIKV